MKAKQNNIIRSAMVAYLFLLTTIAFSQNVGINTNGNSPDTSAMLDVVSTSKGLLIPRVSLSSLTDAGTIKLPATSLLVYNTNGSLANGLGYFYNSGSTSSPVWVKLVTTTDGIVKSVTSGGDVIKLERFPMAEISMMGNTTLTNVLSANAWAKVAGGTALSSGAYQFDTASANNRLRYTGSSMKMFHIACTISVKAVLSGSNLKAVLYKYTAATSTLAPLNAGIVQTKMLSNTDIISTAIHVATNMSNGDYLELWITNTVGIDDFTVTEMNLFAMGISMGMD
ncbi:MAG: hypothetical protein WCO54_10540 [Bacteroidota bacterium]